MKCTPMKRYFQAKFRKLCSYVTRVCKNSKILHWKESECENIISFTQVSWNSDAKDHIRFWVVFTHLNLLSFLHKANIISRLPKIALLIFCYLVSCHPFSKIRLGHFYTLRVPYLHAKFQRILMSGLRDS